MADSDWKRRVGIEINFGSDDEDDGNDDDDGNGIEGTAAGCSG